MTNIIRYDIIWPNILKVGNINMKWTEEDKERLNEFINELLY